MTIYFFLYLLIILYASMCQRVTIQRRSISANTDIKIRKKGAASFGIFIFIFLLLALRHQSMGIDLGYDNVIGYLSNFERIAETDWTKIFNGARFQHYETGYVIINKIIGTVTKERQMFIAITVLLSIYPIHTYIKKQSDNVLMSWIIYLGLPIFLMIYSGLRQAIAIGICTLSITFIKNKKIVPFVVIVALASFVHSSAWIFALAYIIYYIPIKKNARIVTLIAILAINIFKAPLLGVLGSLFGISITIDNNGAWMFFALLVLIYIFGMMYSDGEKETEGELNILFLACVCQAFSSLNSIVARMGYYFLPILLVLLPRIICRIKDEDVRFISKTAVYIGFIAYGLFSIWSTEWAQASPYMFFWQ